MKKIPTLFVRDPADMTRVTRDVTLGCEWVLVGEGVATVKHDGTACLVEGGRLFKRYTVKGRKPPPAGFVKCGETVTPNARHPGGQVKQQGWVPVGEGPEDARHREAFARVPGIADGTYELMGPGIQGNPEGYAEPTLVAHGDLELPDFPRDFDEIAEALGRHEIEGVVWHHEDGRMAKVKRRDFGHTWPVRG